MRGDPASERSNEAFVTGGESGHSVAVAPKPPQLPARGAIRHVICRASAMQQARNTPRLDLWLSRAGAFVCAVAFSAPARALPEGPTDVDRPVTDSKSSRAERERWMATLEGYTRAPVDLGIALGLELPFGLRLSTSLGWVPPAYMGLITSTIASTTGDARAEAFLENASYEGRSWSAQVGYRPFSRYGVYVD